VAVHEGRTFHGLRDSNSLYLGLSERVVRIDLDTLEVTTLAVFQGYATNLQLLGETLYYIGGVRLVSTPTAGGEATVLHEPVADLKWLRAAGTSLYFRDALIAFEGLFVYDTITGEVSDTGRNAFHFEVEGDLAYFDYGSLFVAQLPDLDSATELPGQAPPIFFPTRGGVYWPDATPAAEYWWTSEDGEESVRRWEFATELTLLAAGSGQVLAEDLSGDQAAYFTMPLEGGEPELLAELDIPAFTQLVDEDVFLMLVSYTFEPDSITASTVRSAVVQLTL
jgi:hypothetical protein